MNVRWVKPFLVTLGWGVSNASITLSGMFQGILLPRGRGGLLGETQIGPVGPLVFYLAYFGISVVAGLALQEPGSTLFSYFVSYGGGAIITYWILTLPGTIGVFPVPEILVRVAIIFTFSALFPFPLIFGLLGTFLGLVLADHYFS